MMIARGALEVIGKDAFSFLQGQLTCNMNEITAMHHPGALCNNKGRVIASLEVQQRENAFRLYLPAPMVSIVLNTLRKYARFSAVELKETALMLPPIDLLASIRQKTAVILPETSGVYTPHELNYHTQNFISFNKGCYIGQEIVARMHYLGKLKKQLRYLQVNSPSDLPDPIVNSVKIDDSHYEALAVQPVNQT
jgi:folate-binding protein YgfZ